MGRIERAPHEFFGGSEVYQWIPCRTYRATFGKMAMPYPSIDTQQGWGVFRIVPWHMHGIYLTEAEADAEAEKVGCQYYVAVGSSHARTGNFTIV